MAIALNLIRDELAYLRMAYEQAVREGVSIIANSIASDIADLVTAETVIERLERDREQGIEQAAA